MVYLPRQPSQVRRSRPLAFRASSSPPGDVESVAGRPVQPPRFATGPPLTGPRLPGHVQPPIVSNRLILASAAVSRVTSPVSPPVLLTPSFTPSSSVLTGSTNTWSGTRTRVRPSLPGWVLQPA